MSKGRKPNMPQGRGAISEDALYPVSVFMRKLGIGRHSMNALRKRGLPVRSIGTRLMVDGQEALAFLRRQWHDPEADQGEPVSIQEEQSR